MSTLELNKADHPTHPTPPLFDPKWYVESYPDVAGQKLDPFSHYRDFGAAEGRSPHPLFDASWYKTQNPDVAAAGIDPREHFLLYGAKEGRPPNPLFDVTWYLRRYPEVAASGTNPLVDFIEGGAEAGRNPHPLFDCDWYLRAYPELNLSRLGAFIHYRTRGAAEGRSPHPLFDARWYLDSYPDVGASRRTPLEHFLDDGAREGRRPNVLFDTQWYVVRYDDVAKSGRNPLIDFVDGGAEAGRNPHPLFDCGWYVRAYPELGLSRADALSHYLERGARERRNPHPLFDAQWYLARNGDVHASGADPFIHFIEHGFAERRSPHVLFDADWYLRQYGGSLRANTNPLVDYIHGGAAAGRNPHPLFDGAWYIESNPDLKLKAHEALAHFIHEGGSEGRSPSQWFDARWYLQNYPEVALRRLNPLSHYVETGHRKNCSPNPLFDPAWYVREHADAVQAYFADRGRSVSALEHFVMEGAAANLRTSAYFDPAWYVTRYPDVADTAAQPLAHFLSRGAREGRDPHPKFSSEWYAWQYLREVPERPVPIYDYITRGHFDGVKPNAIFDPAWYLQRYRDVANANNEPFGHYLTADENEDRYPAKVIELVGTVYGRETADRIERYFLTYGISAAGGKAWPPSERLIEDWVTALRRAGPSVPPDKPMVSVIVPVFNQLPYTLACINSLLDHEAAASFEIVVGDDASTDATAAAIGRLPFVRLMRSELNRGFIHNCNAAAAQARGRYVVFLNNDTMVLPGWLDELVGTLERDPTIGLAGSKLIFGTGELQEAGGIIWRDGSAWNYGRGQDPQRPEFNYMRDVDYVSGASIMLPAELWRALKGFDGDYYEVAYGEDSDLAFRVRAAGKRVVLQPLSALLHFEGVTSGTDTSAGVKAYQISNGKKLYERWRSVLAAHRSPGEDPIRERERNIGKRVLFLDAVTPAPDEDAGSLTCLELMRAFQANGYKVNFIPWSNFGFARKRTPDLQRIGIEAIYWPHYSSKENYLAEAGHLFDLVFIFRNEVSFASLDLVHKYAPQAGVIFHVSDLHFVREARKAELERSTSTAAARQQQAREIYSVTNADVTVVHSTFEKEILAKYAPDSQVYVFPWILDSRASIRGYDEREGISYLGGFGHPPNVDAVTYFVSSIWPKIRAARPDLTFSVYGSHAPDEIRALDGKDNVRVVGYVDDLGDCFNTTRVSVAPLRYGAGVKGKIAMAMAYGVPVVTTPCGAEGMGLVEGETALIADNEDRFAKAVLRVYEDRALWGRMSAAGTAFIDRNYSTKRGIERVREIVELVQRSRRGSTLS